MADTDPATVAAVLEHMEENLWFSGKSLERARQLLLNRQREPGRFDVLPLLLSRRLKRVAADLEFLEEFQSLYAEWLAATHQQAPPALLALRARSERRHGLTLGAPSPPVRN
jgi:hypothetical protein